MAVFPSSRISTGSFWRGLYCGVAVVASQGTSVFNSNGKPFSCSAMRTLRAYGDGEALMSCHILRIDKQICWYNDSKLVKIRFCSI